MCIILCWCLDWCLFTWFLDDCLGWCLSSELDLPPQQHVMMDVLSVGMRSDPSEQPEYMPIEKIV